MARKPKTNQNPIELCRDQRIYFRNLFRSARAKAQKNAENFQDILFALEKLGQTRDKPKKINELGLRNYKNNICNLIITTSKQESSSYYVDHNKVYDIINDYRNDALHQGAVARNLTSRAIYLALLIEDALMSDQDTISSYMVSNVVVAEKWHPISFVRQKMLENSFSYLPFFHNNIWYLISDHGIAKYLRYNMELFKNHSDKNNERIERLSSTIEDALKNQDNKLIIEKANIITPQENISKLVEQEIQYDHRPLIVIKSQQHPEMILGIITPFDIL